MCAPDARRSGWAFYAARWRVINGGRRMRPAPQQRLYPIIPLSNFLESISSGLGPSVLAQHSREMMWNRNASNSWSGIHRWVMPVRGPSVDTVKKGALGCPRKGIFTSVLRGAASTSGEPCVQFNSLSLWNVQCCKSRSYLWNWLVACSALIVWRCL